METEPDGESYTPVNDDPLQLEHALIEVTPGCNDHLALLHSSNATESQVIYEIILGRTSESAIIVHPTTASSSEDALEVVYCIPGQ